MLQLTEKNNKRIAIVGATGFIGSHLVDRFVEEGANVLAVARSEIRRENLQSASGRYEFAACDIVASPGLSDIFKRFRPDVVYHLAALPDAAETPEQIEESLKVNAFGTLKLLEAARNADVKRFVFGGSCKTYGHHQVPSRCDTPLNPLSSYAIAKATGWQLCKLFSTLYGMETASIQPAFVYGPRQNWNLIRYVEQCVNNGKPVTLQGGGQTRDPLYIDDVVEAFVLCGLIPEVDAECIPVGGGTELTVSDLVHRILAAMGASSTPVEIGAQQPRATEIWRNYTDNSDALRVLGWSPKTSLGEGLRKTFAASSNRLAKAAAWSA